MNIIKSICVAFSMYSKIPMPRVEWNEKNMKYAMCFFPLVGAVIGGLMLLVRFLCGRFGFNTSVYAVVMTALPVLVSGVYGLGTICAAVISFLWYRHVAYSKFGGITGDIAGYFVCICEVLCVIFGGVLCVLL